MKRIQNQHILWIFIAAVLAVAYLSGEPPVRGQALQPTGGGRDLFHSILNGPPLTPEETEQEFRIMEQISRAFSESVNNTVDVYLDPSEMKRGKPAIAAVRPGSHVRLKDALLIRFYSPADPRRQWALDLRHVAAIRYKVGQPVVERLPTEKSSRLEIQILEAFLGKLDLYLRPEDLRDDTATIQVEEVSGHRELGKELFLRAVPSDADDERWLINQRQLVGFKWSGHPVQGK